MQILDLKIGSTYTIVSFNAQGWPEHWPLRITAIHEHLEKNKYDVHGVHKHSGAKIRLRFYQGRQFMIWEGIVKPNTSIEVEAVIMHHMTGLLQGFKNRMIKAWPKGDTRYMYRALESLLQAPIMLQIESRPKGNVKLIEVCYESITKGKS